MKVNVLSCVGLFVFAGLSACTWKAKVLDSEEVSRNGRPLTGLVIPVEFESQRSSVGPEGCALIVSSQGGLSKYEVPFHEGDSQVFAELDPDVYYFKEIYCGKVHLDLLSQDIPMVMVRKNKISFAVGLKISAGESLDRNFFSLFDKSRSQQETIRALKSLPPEARSRAISAYTGKTITVEGLDSSLPEPALEVAPGTERPLKPIRLPGPILTEVRECKLIESKRNPLPFGNVIIEADYSQQSLKNIAQLPSWNVLNPEFPNCLIAAVKKFQPDVKRDLRVQYTF